METVSKTLDRIKEGFVSNVRTLVKESLPGFYCFANSEDSFCLVSKNADVSGLAGSGIFLFAKSRPPTVLGESNMPKKTPWELLMLGGAILAGSFIAAILKELSMEGPNDTGPTTPSNELAVRTSTAVPIDGRHRYRGFKPLEKRYSGKGYYQRWMAEQIEVNGVCKSREEWWREVRTERKRLGVKWSDVAQRVGIERQQIRRLNDGNQPNNKTLIKLIWFFQSLK